jgi:hypothetical protein
MNARGISIPPHPQRCLIGILPTVIPPHLISIDIPTVTDTVEEDSGALDIIANAVVTYPNASLAGPHISQLAASKGIFLEFFQGFNHPLVGDGIESAEVSAEAIRDDKIVARHVMSASFPDALSPRDLDGARLR